MQPATTACRAGTGSCLPRSASPAAPTVTGGSVPGSGRGRAALPCPRASGQGTSHVSSRSAPASAPAGGGSRGNQALRLLPPGTRCGSCYGPHRRSPLTGLLTLGSTRPRFQTEPPACYRASWHYPDRTFTGRRRRAYEHEETPLRYVTVSPPVLLGARKFEANAGGQAPLRENDQQQSRGCLVSALLHERQQ